MYNMVAAFETCSFLPDPQKLQVIIATLTPERRKMHLAESEFVSNVKNAALASVQFFDQNNNFRKTHF